jgi:hypothetical protein
VQTQAKVPNRANFGRAHVQKTNRPTQTELRNESTETGVVFRRRRRRDRDSGQGSVWSHTRSRGRRWRQSRRRRARRGRNRRRRGGIWDSGLGKGGARRKKKGGEKSGSGGLNSHW